MPHAPAQSRPAVVPVVQSRRAAACHVFQRETRFCTAAGFPAAAVEPGRELWILHPGGDPEAARRLRLHFELHVYAMLLARGRREMAERHLGHSPLLTEAPAALDRPHRA